MKSPASFSIRKAQLNKTKYSIELKAARLLIRLKWRKARKSHLKLKDQ